MPKCKHGMPAEDQCSICKDWPSFERMKTKFPYLSHDIFFIMSPAERVEAMKTGTLRK